MSPLTREQLLEQGEYFDGRSSEILQQRDFTEEVMQIIEDLDLDDTSPDTLELGIRDAAPFEITVYVSRTWTEKMVESWAENVVERLVDEFDNDDEMADPEDSLQVNVEAHQKLLTLATALVREFALHAKPWAADDIGTIIIDADEAVYLARFHNAHWFEAKP